MKNMFTNSITGLSALALLSCHHPQIAAPQDQFMQNLQELCGKAFAGTLVSTDAADDDLAGQPMVMHIRSCTDTEIQIPFYVGDDRSRTWILTKTDEGLRLKHRHNHEDGTADGVSMYGGNTTHTGSTTAQEFPVDQESVDMFVKEGLNVSVTNIWSVKLTDTLYTYEMRRKGRLFRVEFDLSKAVPTPQKPW